jgi:hypothetical protein
MPTFATGIGWEDRHPENGPHHEDGDKRMEIDKSQIIELLKSRGEDAKAAQAEAELPNKVDPEAHASVLAEVGIEPQDLLGNLPGGLGGIGG